MVSVKKYDSSGSDKQVYDCLLIKEKDDMLSHAAAQVRGVLDEAVRHLAKCVKIKM